MALIKRKLSPLKPSETIDYKNINLLQSCLTNQGKIMSRRMTNLTLKQQRQLSKAVKRARILNLLSLEQKKKSIQVISSEFKKRSSDRCVDLTLKI